MLYRYNDKDVDLLGRLIRAEALGEGAEGMLKVGNVVTNRIIVNCLDFKDLKTLNDVLYQKKAFAGTTSPLFTSRATTKEKELAEKALKGYKLYPSTNALWFHSMDKEICRPTWYGYQLAGRYKNHCFYRPDPGVCSELQ